MIAISNMPNKDISMHKNWNKRSENQQKKSKEYKTEYKQTSFRYVKCLEKYQYQLVIWKEFGSTLKLKLIMKQIQTYTIIESEIKTKSNNEFFFYRFPILISISNINTL